MERADGGSKKSTVSFFITFLQGGQGRFRFLPLGPPAPPRNPIETIAPRRGTALYAEFVLQFKLSPFTGKVSRRSRDERGMAQSCQVPRVIPPQSAYADSSPASGGAFGCGANSAHGAVPLRGAIVSMGLRGVQGGLRGEIEIFPGPPAKRL